MLTDRNPSSLVDQGKSPAVHDSLPIVLMILTPLVGYMFAILGMMSQT